MEGEVFTGEGRDCLIRAERRGIGGVFECCATGGEETTALSGDVREMVCEGFTDG